MKKQETTGYVFIAGFGLLLLWLLRNSQSLLHESVQASIVTPQNTVTPDPLTGAPRYDTSFSATVPEQEAFAIPPIAPNGQVTQHPNDPRGASCPIGYTLWNNAHDNSYWCLPNS